MNSLVFQRQLYDDYFTYLRSPANAEVRVLRQPLRNACASMPVFNNGVTGFHFPTVISISNLLLVKIT